jgi:poly(3-hydroxybutyrate) depolymerase
MRELTDRFEYLLHIPEGDGPWPLLLYLHGIGEAREQGPDHGGLLPLSAVKKNGAPPFQCDPRNPHGCRSLVDRFIVVSPQLRRRGPWEPDLGLVGSLVRDLLTRYPLDANRLFVTGFSVGGTAAVELVRRERLRFAKWIAVDAHRDPPGWTQSAAGQVPHLLVNGPIGICESRTPKTTVVRSGRDHVGTAEATYSGKLLVDGARNIYDWLLDA